MLHLMNQREFVSELVMDKSSIMKEHSLSTNATFQPGVKGFKIQKLIGRGSYAKVFLVTKTSNGKPYAMKVLKKSEMENKKDITRLFNEKEIIQNIDHPFIVKLHYTFQTQEKAYFILDLLNGGDLYTHITKYGKFKENRARLYAAEIVLALS